jgi:excisionase family DNA binding protein
MKHTLLSTNGVGGYDPSRFCSTQSAANLLAVSHRTVQLWVENGTLRAWKTAGGHRRISLDSIEKLVSIRQEAIGAQQFSKESAFPRKVLLVDQDQTLVSLYETEMRRWGLPIIIMKAFDGFNALIRMGEVRPDLLIIDLSMSGIDAARMVRALRENVSYKNISIIIISGLETKTVKAMELPKDVAVFTKPLSFDQMRAAVERALAVV